MEIGFAAILALWALSRSGLRARLVYPVMVNNPWDKLTEGSADMGGIVQPTYNKIPVGFEAPTALLCYSSRISLDKMRQYQVWKIGDVAPRVDIKVPGGYPGAGNVFNRSNWITQNMGEGYYVMIKALKTGRGGREDYSNSTLTPAQITAFTQRAIGVSWVKYETAQRFVKHNNKMTAKEQMDELIDLWDSFYDPDPAPPTPQPPTPQPPTEPPLLPPGGGITPYDPPSGGDDPVDPTPIDPTPIDPTPIDPPSPGLPPGFTPVGGSNNGSLIGNGKTGGLMGGY